MTLDTNILQIKSTYSEIIKGQTTQCDDFNMLEYCRLREQKIQVNWQQPQKPINHCM